MWGNGDTVEDSRLITTGIYHDEAQTVLVSGCDNVYDRMAASVIGIFREWGRMDMDDDHREETGKDQVIDILDNELGG
ncbi:unnamed protein product [Anisakis simplex]|uniref:PPM-type phosphatase domain-containing protein n=1 Tax=Anisakis simplex TaxID=6269 RepID=A0A0M3JUK0_ANISI|nr:unnamed protein product [Anisakis simplex]